MNAAHFINRTNRANVFAADHEQARVHRAKLVPLRFGGWFQTEHLAERHTDQQLAAHVRQTHHHAAAPVRQRVNRGQVGDFTDHGGRQREPLRADAKNDDRMRIEQLGLLRLGEMTRPIGEVIGRGIAIEQRQGPGGVNRTVAAVNVFFQFRARGVAVHADSVPAIVDVGASEVSIHVWAVVHVSSCYSVPADARGFATAAPPPCCPFSPSAMRDG